MKIMKKDSKDWCHLCGIRSNKFAEISYPENAEHSQNRYVQGKGKFLRICLTCTRTILQEIEK